MTLRAQPQDFSKVEIKATKVAGTVYMLEGSGGNIGVSAGPDGILIIDDQYAPLADKIRAALNRLGEGKLKSVKARGRRLILRSDLEAFFAQLQEEQQT